MINIEKLSKELNIVKRRNKNKLMVEDIKYIYLCTLEEIKDVEGDCNPSQYDILFYAVGQAYDLAFQRGFIAGRTYHD